MCTNYISRLIASISKLSFILRKTASDSLMITMSWMNEEDVIRDFSLFAVVNPNGNQAPPPTVLEYQARLSETGNSSIYDVPLELEENITRVNTGRGRGCFSTYRPGGTRSEPDDFEEIKRRLKEANGIGFSNEVIEENYRRNVASNKPTTPLASSTDDEMFVDAISEPQTPTTSPFGKPCVPVPDCPTTSSSPRPKRDTPPVNLSKTGSSSSQSPPLPLSKILSLGKRNGEKSKTNTWSSKTNTSNSEVSSDDSDYWWNREGADSSQSDSSPGQWNRPLKKKHGFDISSQMDFPELR